MGQIVYEIDFKKLKSMSLHEQCNILQDSIQGQAKQFTIEQPEQEMRLLIQDIFDKPLRTSLQEIGNYIEFLNQSAWELISVCQELQLDGLMFQVKFDLLRLKNLYPNLQINQEFVSDAGQVDCQSFSQWKCLYGSVLIQKLIYMWREGMQMSFRESFQEAMQVKEIPGSCFNSLFKHLSQASTILIKMKEQSYGYLEDLQMLERQSYDEFDFNVHISRYLSVEAEGYLVITLKAKGVGSERKKMRLLSQTLQLKGNRKMNFTIKQTIPQSKGGLYSVSKVTLMADKFKLYFIINQKLNGQKFYIHNPNFDIHSVLKPKQKEQFDANNFESYFLIRLLEIPRNVSSIDFEFQGQFSHIVEYQKLQEGVEINKSVVTGDIGMTLSVLMKLTCFTEAKLSSFKIRINGSNGAQSQTLAKNLWLNYESICAYKEIPLDLEDQRVIEFQGFKDCYLKNSQQTLHDKKIRILFKKGESYQINYTNIDLNNLKSKFDNEIDQKWFQTIQTPLQSCLDQGVDLLRLVDLVSRPKSQKKLFSADIRALVPKETNIPFRKAEYYTINLRLQFRGSKEDEGYYSIKLEGQDGKIIIKDKRTVYQKFTVEDSPFIHNFTAFLGTENFRQPQLIICKHNESDGKIDKALGLQVQHEQTFELMIGD